ncbi:MAG: hypothetical protein IT435_02365 [Phycisphaerales bacterium]|nr:hypothetical protein [Phycisphaerales bacterium]
MAVVVKVDSNITGLRYCQEVTLGVLDGTAANQRWVELEPNTYSDFGGNTTTVARNPINPGRQRKKGVVTNVEASAGWDTDLTQTNMQDMLQGFFYADLRKKQEFTGVAQTVDTSDDSYGASGIHTGYFAGDLVLASGYTNAANNGLKNVTAATGNKVTVSQNLVNETSPTTAKLVAVGFQFGSGEVEIVNSGSEFPYLNRASGSKDFTELGFIPGEFAFLGGDAAGVKFATAANNGFVRIRSVTATRITFDKTAATMVTDTGSGKTIQIFKARVLKNEVGTLIKRRSYTLERTLGYANDTDITKEQAEYVHGAVPNEFTFNVNAADKLTADLAFIGLRPSAIDENVSGANTLLSKISGVVRVPVEEADAFNTSSDITRVRLASVSSTNAFPSPLFTYAEDLTIAINNNNGPNNAVGVLGAFEVTAGTFEVGGEINAYFGDVASVQAVQNNADITLDLIAVKSNTGIAIDVPLISLGNGRLNVEQDQPVKIPLESNAATAAKISSTTNHTLLMCFFDYLPNAAA